MLPTISANWVAVALASSRICANTPRNSPLMRAVRSPAAIACSRPDSDCRLPSAVDIKVLRLSTITRKSYWNRSASPRALKSPLAADCASCLISAFIADRLCLTWRIAAVMLAFSPGRSGMSSLKSPMA